MDDTELPSAVAADPAPLSAKAQLRAFEDDVFGKKVSRINGEVERGIGSPFSQMTTHQSAHYAALQQLVTAEQGMADATAALASAQAAHDAAIKAASAASEAMAETE